MFDVQKVLLEATNALKSGKQVKCAWPARGKVDGKVWNAATFDVDGEPWGVVSGAQRPPAAQLLDAAAAYSHHHGGRKVVAFIGPDDKHEHAPAEFRHRFQTAAWHGLGIVWIESEGPGAHAWAPGGPPQKGDFEAIATSCQQALDEAVARDPGAWNALLGKRDSRAAEPDVRAAFTAALMSAFGFAEEKKRKFQASWRGGEADGVWRREKGVPRSLALEVKIAEDGNAPLCQVFDDLGAFDAAIHVRLVGASAKAIAPEGMREAMARAEKALPLKYLRVHVGG